jgi:hypothetical protein
MQTYIFLIEIANTENTEQFYCEAICFKLHPFGVKTKCGHTFCLSCIYEMLKENPSLCAYCRTPLSIDFIKNYSFVDVNLKNLKNIEIEDLQNCFPVLPLLPNTTPSDVLEWLSKDDRIDINFVCPSIGGNALFWAAYSGNLDIIKVLVEQKAKTDYVNKIEASTFHLATKHNVEIIDFFLQLGININQNGKSGTALLWGSKIW